MDLEIVPLKGRRTVTFVTNWASICKKQTLNYLIKHLLSKYFLQKLKQIRHAESFQNLVGTSQWGAGPPR